MKTKTSPSPSFFSVLKAMFFIAFWPLLAGKNMLCSRFVSKNMFLFFVFGVIGWTSLGVIVMTYKDIERLDWNIFQLTMSCICYIFFCWRTLLLIIQNQDEKRT